MLSQISNRKFTTHLFVLVTLAKSTLVFPERRCTAKCGASPPIFLVVTQHTQSWPWTATRIRLTSKSLVGVYTNDLDLTL